MDESLLKRNDLIKRRNKLSRKQHLTDKEKTELEQLHSILGKTDNREPWKHNRSYLNGLYGVGGLK